MSIDLASRQQPPLDQVQNERLQQAVAGLDAAQLQWMSGYVAGLAAKSFEQVPPIAATGNALSVLYGSQTGNGEAIAKVLAARAADAGFTVRLTSLADYKPSQLKRENVVIFVVSTHGEGDPPDDAEIFREFLLSAKAPQLDALKYTVLALGDSSYINFCETGREFDRRLAELGAERLQPITECDLDYEAAAAAWSEAVLEELPDLLEAGNAAPRLRAVATSPKFDKHNPLTAEILVNQKITSGNSSKDVRHLELSLQDSGLHYEPGDSLAVLASNPPALVEQLLAELGFDGDARLATDTAGVSLRELLTNRLEITALNLGFLRAWAELSDNDELRAVLEPGQQEALSDFVDRHQIIDVIRHYPASPGVAEFVAALRTLSPRSYSIASSAAANPDEVHLTVAAVRYDAFGSEHWGAASTHLADRLEEGDQVEVYVESNSRFRLPASDDTPIIMIGPGTGVAPFRAFVEERAERGAAGRNWLFFGDRTFANDFLYQLEWQRHLKQGNLERLDVAFSRDQVEKFYVQDRIRERGQELYDWIEQGAHLYVCGDSKNMAGDIDDALIDIFATHGSLDHEAAAQRTKELRREGRYQRDVY